MLQPLPSLAPNDPVARLLPDLPREWQNDVLGPQIDGWAGLIESSRTSVLRLGDLPDRLRIEFAWMARWQAEDGLRISVTEFSQAAAVVAWGIASGRTKVSSMTEIEPEEFAKLHRLHFQMRHGRLPAASSMSRFQRVLFGAPQLALTARLNTHPWWTLDTWSPRCDPRIPVREREPRRAEGFTPGRIRTDWLRDAAKWHFGTTLEAGTLTWSTITGARSPGIFLFDRWLQTLDSAPATALKDPARAGVLAAAFRRWSIDPSNKNMASSQRTNTRVANGYVRAVVDLMDFIGDHHQECWNMIGPSPWDDLTGMHSAIWRRQILKDRSAGPVLSDENYIDDTALGQITASLPALANINPQVMRMLLLQILTGRRAGEVCLCGFDCLSPATDRAIAEADGEQIARWRYAQSKIDRAPDTILVDAEVVAVIKEQQQWVRDRFPGASPRYLFPQTSANARGVKHFNPGNYGRALREFSATTDLTDGEGRRVQLSRTHRFRHTRITRLAELGLPVHVLQRYAGHANPTMSMHYVARREEHSEQAFLATKKFKVDGTSVVFSREDHDGMQLFDRADRFLPHGYCLLPPLQTCDKGNACLTCSMFVTDSSHIDTLKRQLDETNSLIDRQTVAFQDRHGKPMPETNVWLVQRRAEREALARLLTAMQEAPGRSCQGAGSPTAGPTPITLDTTRHRKT